MSNLNVLSAEHPLCATKIKSHEHFRVEIVALCYRSATDDDDDQCENLISAQLIHDINSASNLPHTTTKLYVGQVTAQHNSIHGGYVSCHSNYNI